MLALLGQRDQSAEREEIDSRIRGFEDSRIREDSGIAERIASSLSILGLIFLGVRESPSSFPET
jgi:hypothetical protein